MRSSISRDLDSVKERIAPGADGVARSAARTSTLTPRVERRREARDSRRSVRRAVMTHGYASESDFERSRRAGQEIFLRRSQFVCERDFGRRTQEQLHSLKSGSVARESRERRVGGGFQTRMVPSKTLTAAPLTRGTRTLPLCVTSTSMWLGRPISSPCKMVRVCPAVSLPCLTR